MNRIAQALVLGLSLLSPVYAAEEAPPLRDVVDHVSPSVVGVIVELSEPAEPSKDQNQGSQVKTRDGTGMVFSSEGHIVTAIHVVEKANKITVVFANNSRSMAQVVGTDPVTGIAMLKVSGVLNLAPVHFGDAHPLRRTDRHLGERGDHFRITFYNRPSRFSLEMMAPLFSISRAKWLV
jgi:S1-C subfamily serine protease